MYTKIDKLVTESLEKEKNCKNCQDQPICEINNSLREQACKNWKPSLHEYEKRWEIVELFLKGKTIEEAAQEIKNKGLHTT